MLTVERAQREFHRLNSLYFDGRLPDAEIEVVKDLRLDGGKRSRLYGATQKDADGFRIQLLAGMPTDLWVLKLGHEMAHIETWPKSHRSKEWKSIMSRMARAGFLAEVF